ncbi:MAG: hypothetical protein RLW61_14435 [Gammaproteobacteria bacterium]
MPTVVLNRFDEDNPLDYDKLNANMQSIVAAINALAGDDVLQLGVVVDDSPQYMPKAGGTFLGQVAAPSLLVDSSPVVTQATAATAAVRGAVKRAANVAALAQSISNPPTQAQVTAIQTALNDILTAIKAAEQMATS